jgi:hypothetical protein
VRNFLSKGVIPAIAAIGVGQAAQAAPTISGDFLFTERRGENSAIPYGHMLVIGAGSITPSGAGTSATASHVPLGSGPDYALSYVPAPIFPDQYAAVVPYAGQTGRWQIAATDSTGTATRLTHVLDDVRDLPLITGLTVSGSVLAPHLTWDAVDPSLYPSSCGGSFGACALGYDFFNYQVEVRLVTGTPGNLAPQVFASASMATSALPTFDIPVGVLTPGNDYLIGIRLTHRELEGFLPTGGFFTALENRSTAYVSHTAPIPEPDAYAMLLAGLGLLGFIARRRQAQR